MLLIVLSSASCKTTKTTVDASASSHTQVQAVVQAAEQRHTDSTTLTQTVQQTSAGTVSDELTEETLWSAPDSTGRQHAISTKRTVRRSASVTDSDWHQMVRSQAVIAEEARITDSIAAASDTQAAQHTNTAASIDTPAWANLLVVAIVAAALIVVILFLRKWRII